MLSFDWLDILCKISVRVQLYHIQMHYKTRTHWWRKSINYFKNVLSLKCLCSFGSRTNIFLVLLAHSRICLSNLKLLQEGLSFERKQVMLTWSLRPIRQEHGLAKHKSLNNFHYFSFSLLCVYQLIELVRI